jgi:ethanolamine utilization protein EutQ
MGKRLISESDVRQAASEGRRFLAVPPDECIVTPMALDVAAALGIALQAEAGHPSAANPEGGPPSPSPADPGDPGPLVARVIERLKDHLPAGLPAERLAEVVREVVAARLRSGGAAAVARDGARLIAAGQAPSAPLRAVDAQGQVRVAQILPVDAAQGLSAGILAWENDSFQRQVEQEEIDIIVQGDLQVRLDDGQALNGGPGDVLFLPRGTRVVYSASGSVRLVCVNRL